MIEEHFNWENLFNIANIMITLTTELEKDRSSICEVYFFLFQALNALRLMPESRLCQELISALILRFTREGSMNLICAAFLCSPYGYAAYKRESVQRMKAMIYNSAKRGIEQYAVERVIFNFQLVLKGFDEFLNQRNIDFHGATSPEIFWEHVMKSNQEATPEYEFARLAIEIVQIPCSEAPVERFFSHIEKIISPQRRNLKPKMIRAISIIKMNYLFAEEMQNGCQYPALADEIDKGIAGIMRSTFVPPVNQMLWYQSQNNKN